MAITNREIADAFEHIAELLEARGDNPFRARAYRRAAYAIRRLKKNLDELIAEEYDLTQIHWIGKGIATQIRNIIDTGTLPEFEKLISYKPKPPRQNKILRQRKERQVRLFHVIPAIEALLSNLRKISSVRKVECASSYRRRQELVGNVDILIETENFIGVVEWISQSPAISEILNVQEHSVRFLLHSGNEIHLHQVSSQKFGSQLLYFTGATEHYRHLQELAVEMNYELNPEGLFKQTQCIASYTENDIYQHLQCEYIEPELRENRGEIEAAQQHTLPKLIEMKDIKGDLHSHTDETDGTVRLELMVEAAIERGYEYFAITDHSRRLAITNGLDEKRLWQQIKLIDQLNQKFNGFTILKSIEVDILEDGSLDLPDTILKELDIRVCSIHSRFRISREKQTERLLRAMDNPYCNIIGHPTGRLINRRVPYELDMEKIFQTAKERNCFMELNGQPYRLDLNDQYCLIGKNMGVKFAISSDAHSIGGLNFMQLGIYQARRGWLEAKDVINTRKLKDLKKLLTRV